MVLSGRSDGRWSFSCAGLAILVIFCFIVPLPRRYGNPRNALVQHVAEITKEHLPDGIKSDHSSHGAGISTVKSKYAFATFLASDAQESEDTVIDNDLYFIATRILAYQILHAPETKSRTEIPFIVLVNEGVSEMKRERLRRDGAIVWQPKHGKCWKEDSKCAEKQGEATTHGWSTLRGRERLVSRSIISGKGRLSVQRRS